MPAPSAEPSGTTLVIPCHDEADRLDPDALAQLPLRHGIDLLLVDDGSTDATPRLLQRLAARLPGSVHSLSLSVNSGKSEAVRRGLVAALDSGAAVVGYLDADLSTPADEAARLFAVRQELDLDVVLGSRVKLLGRSIDRQPWRHYSGRIFATVASAVLALPVYDTQCGAKIFRTSPALRAALARPFRNRWAFDVELLQRLMLGPPGRPDEAVPLARIVEEPLRRWRDVPGSKLGLAASVGATLALLPLALPTLRHHLAQRLAHTHATRVSTAPAATPAR